MPYVKRRPSDLFHLAELQALLHHELESLHKGMLRLRHRFRAGVEAARADVKPGAVSTFAGEADGVELDILALHAPASCQRDERHGLSSMSPGEALGAFSLSEMSSPGLRSITRLAPEDGLTAFGLMLPSRSR
jgi:hypothetical protein